MSTEDQTDSQPSYKIDSSSAQQQSREYWDARAKGYSISTRKELDMDSNVLRNIMRNQLGLNRKLKAVDMGTGAGLAAITMARLGHDVTAVDSSEKMLEYARRNASYAHVDVNFVLGDVSSPPLLKHEYDILVAKSVIWNLTDPVGAYSAWMDLLKPGGFMIIIDGNWYLDEFDEDFRKRRRFLDMKYGKDKNLHASTNVDNVDLNIIRRLTHNFPASMERRPAWDMGVLLGLGFADFHILSLDKEPFSVLTRDGVMKIPLSFAIIAHIPKGSLSPYHELMEPVPYTDDDLRAISERIHDLDLDYGKVLKALSDTNRLSLVSALMGGRMNVNQLANVTGQSISLTSHNLKILKDCNIVSSERDGKEIQYALTNRMSINMLVDVCNGILNDTSKK